MRAIILAAGRGTRLGDLGTDLPKSLLPINGQTSLERYRRAFARAGVVTSTIVVGGYRIDALREQLPTGFQLIENVQFATTNSLQSLWLALEVGGDTDIAVFNADVVYEPDLLGRFLRSPRRTAVLIDELRPFDNREYHARVVDGLVREVSDRIPEEASFGQDAQAFKVAGEHLPIIRAYAREQLRSGTRHQYAGGVLSALCDKELLHPVYTNQQAWSEFDTPDDFQRCVDLVAEREGKEPEYWSYGMDDDTPPTVPQVGAPGKPAAAKPPAYLARRLYQCVVHRELPARLTWLPEFIAGFRRSPWRALRGLHPLARRSLSFPGFWLQVYGHELVEAVMSEADALGIRPFLLWGTLLGCVRERGFIPHDHDIDMGLLEDDFRQVPELKRRMLARGFTVRLEGPGKISFRHPRVPRLWVDIDRLHEARDHLWCADAGSDEEVVFAYWFSRASFSHLTSQTFDGVPVFVPGDAEDVLATIYGTWQIRQTKKKHYLRGPLNLMLERKGVEPSVQHPEA